MNQFHKLLVCREFVQNESVPLKDHVLFSCCQGNKPIQRTWLFVCIWVVAHLPFWWSTFSSVSKMVLAKCKFDGLGLC